MYRHCSTNLIVHQQLRYPPVSRLQKSHNCEVSIDALKAAGTVVPAEPRDTVDGQRHKTLATAWQVHGRLAIPERQHLAPLNFDPKDDGRGPKPDLVRSSNPLITRLPHSHIRTEGGVERRGVLALCGDVACVPDQAAVPAVLCC